MNRPDSARRDMVVAGLGAVALIACYLMAEVVRAIK